MSLLDRILDHLRERPALGVDKDGGEADLELRAATAVLLLEAAYGDTEYEWSEEQVILEGLERAFGLGEREVRELLGRANEIRPPVVELADVFRVIRERYDVDQREQVMALVWSVLWADGAPDEWEAGFAAHVARSLGLDRGREREGGDPGPQG